MFAQVARRLEVIPERLDEELGEMSDHALAKTASRRMLGVMNGYAQMADQYRWTEDKVDLIELSCWLAQTPCGPLFDAEFANCCQSAPSRLRWYDLAGALNDLCPDAIAALRRTGCSRG